MSTVRHFRARAARYALAVAVCQLAVLLSATAVLTAAAFGASTVAGDEECRCDHSAAVICPMHTRSSTRQLPPDAPRWCAGVDETAYAVLPTLGVLALPERAPQTIGPAFESLVPAARAGALRPLATPPDSPPPRA